ncbi:MAG: DNA polymerase IV [Gemmatimonadales bacterium]|nr:DNA polymerase IV [Gemmatimonadales bacterium]MBP6570021.1 DNA polymerase IV [Gemmatimonadales bacterium]MBP7620354.1 DNA polymerase IV [Gemmatimonadales bacterium]
MSTRILHCDLDAFFVEVCRRHDPALEGVDLLIVGGRRQSRGVVQSASYGARAFGVRSGMPIAEAARRCPGATFVKGEFAWYKEASRAVRTVLERHAPLVVMTGMDEGYLDFSGTDLLHPVSLLEVATQIRHDVRRSADLDCSIGIGPNRMLAKLASDYAKPRGICEVRSGWERGFLAGLPLKALPGIGPKTADRLAARGLNDVAQVQEMPLDELGTLLGREEAIALKRRADGAGGSIVRASGPPKSVSRETTFPRDVTDAAALDRMLHLLTARVAGQLRDEALQAGAVVLKLRHSDFTTVTRRTTLTSPTALDAELMAAARRLLAPALAAARGKRQAVRLLGIAATALGQAEAPDLFEPEARGKARDVSRAVDAVRARFGFEAMQSARLVGRPDPRRAEADGDAD